MVVGVPGATVAVAVGVGVPAPVEVEVALGVLVMVGVAIGVRPEVGLAVAVVVGVTCAPSSRKSIEGLPHQRSWDGANTDGVAVAVGLASPPKKPVHEVRNIFDRSKKEVICNQTKRVGECFKLDKIRGTNIKTPKFQATSW